MPRYHARHKIDAQAGLARGNSEPIQRFPPCGDSLMRWTILAPAVSLAAALAAPAAAAVNDFRLPADPAAQPEPDRQGPVAPDVPESRRPAPTPAPTATRAATPSVEQPSIVLPDLPAATPAPTPAQTVSAPVATTRPSAAPPTGEAELPTTQSVAADGPVFPSGTRGPAAAAPASARVARPDGGGSSSWLWVLATLAGLGTLGLAGWAWQRRQVSGPVLVPQVERPHLPASPAPEATLPGTGLPVPLQITLEPLRLSLTLMNATLAYRLEIANRGETPIVDLGIGADMISAHASMTREQQLSGPGDGAATLRRIDRLEPGESRIVEGEFRLPFPQIVPIRQGNAALLLPLARFRLAAQGAAPVVRTFAVGESGPKAGLQPFRLDLGPRIYPKLTQRAFA
jgi:hypothetical protein